MPKASYKHKIVNEHFKINDLEFKVNGRRCSKLLNSLTFHYSQWYTDWTAKPQTPLLNSQGKVYLSGAWAPFHQ